MRLVPTPHSPLSPSPPQRQRLHLPISEGVIHKFGDEYLRRPNVGDVQRLLDIGEIGSWVPWNVREPRLYALALGEMSIVMEGTIHQRV